MTRDPGIICFRHCDSNSIFCKCVPRICPICQLYIENYIAEPFAIPYPYTNAKHQPTTIVIRPSRGRFLDYNIASDLHIGIVNSKGSIFEFDTSGLIVNDYRNWMDCVALNIVPSSWDGHWDNTIEIMLMDPKWKSHNYDKIEMNCFNFVIEFLSTLQYMDMKIISKEDMCDKLILSKIQHAIKYNTLFNVLQNNEYTILK